MAAAVPLLLEVGTVAATAYSAYQSYTAGQDAKSQAKVQATAEADAAKGRELQRRQALVRSLSAQNAAAGAGGISTDGSVGAIMRRDINQNAQDLAIDTANTRTRQRAVLQSGDNAATEGTAKALVGTVDGGLNYYKNFGGKKSSGSLL